VHASGRAPLRQIMNAVEEMHTEVAGGHNEKASLQRFPLKIVRQESLHYTSANRSSNEIAKSGSQPLNRALHISHRPWCSLARHGRSGEEFDITELNVPTHQRQRTYSNEPLVRPNIANRSDAFPSSESGHTHDSRRSPADSPMCHSHLSQLTAYTPIWLSGAVFNRVKEQISLSFALATTAMSSSVGHGS
jgi:hypothetical protein